MLNQAPLPPDRSATVDILRGIAVFTMVAANLAGNVLAEPHPLLVRFYGTFSAPMFIMLSGMMVAANQAHGRHGLRYYLLRGSLVVAVGMLIDLLIWQYYPMVSFDVLYLIGVAMPIAYLVAHVPHAAQWMLMATVFLLTPLVQLWLGYSPTSPDWPIKEHTPGELLHNSPDVISHFFADGWFPFFPWVGFALFGVCLHSLQQHLQASFVPLLGRAGWLLLAGGLATWFVFPGPLYTRFGYSELFYPPTYGYILTAMGVVCSTFQQVDLHRRLSFWTPWRYLGRCALLAYVLHYALIRYFFAVLWPASSITAFAVFYVALVLILFAVAYAVRWLKSRHPQQPFLVRFLIGC